VFSKSCRIFVDGGITNKLSARLNAANINADTKYGYNSRLKLTPLESIATISVLDAIFDVKNITVINTNKGENKLAK
jgi:hypothetical protein